MFLDYCSEPAYGEWTDLLFRWSFGKKGMGQNRTVQQDDDVIDLLEILLALKRRLWIIVLAVLAGGCLAGVYSQFILTPQYTSSAMVFVLSKETTLTSLADLQIGSQLANDYQVIIKSRPVLQEVIDRLELDMNYRMLKGKLTIVNEPDTRILTISATDADPQLAKRIVDQVASTSSDYIGEIMEMVPPKLIEDGEVSLVPVSPNKKKNTLIGAMAGGVLVCGLITLGVLLNDTIQSEEDVEKYLELSVLASIPEQEDRQKGNGKQSGRHRKRRKKKRKPAKTGMIKKR